MFQVDDEALQTLGYQTAVMHDDEKAHIKEQIASDLNTRFGAAVAQELTSDELEEFSDIQESPERARRWLQEFHPDYAQQKEYTELCDDGRTTDEADAYYAATLWMDYAVPNFGQIAQRVASDYMAQAKQFVQNAQK